MYVERVHILMSGCCPLCDEMVHSGAIPNHVSNKKGVVEGQPNEMLPFHERLTEDQRRREFSRVSDKLHRFIPIIMERGSLDAPRIDKEKYLVPVDLTMAQLSFVVRKRLQLRAGDALFLLVNKTLCTSTATAGSVYDAHRDTDGFLYVTYTMENTFG